MAKSATPGVGSEFQVNVSMEQVSMGFPRQLWSINLWDSTSQCAADRNRTQESMEKLYLDLPFVCVKCVPFLKKLPKTGRIFTYLEDPGITNVYCILSSDIKDQLWRSIGMMKFLDSKNSSEKSPQVIGHSGWISIFWRDIQIYHKFNYNTICWGGLC